MTVEMTHRAESSAGGDLSAGGRESGNTTSQVEHHIVVTFTGLDSPACRSDRCVNARQSVVVDISDVERWQLSTRRECERHGRAEASCAEHEYPIAAARSGPPQSVQYARQWLRECEVRRDREGDGEGVRAIQIAQGGERSIADTPDLAFATQVCPTRLTLSALATTKVQVARHKIATAKSDYLAPNVYDLGEKLMPE
jgi:hypothetical protein